MPLWSCGGALHALLSLWVHNVLTFSFTSWTNKSPTCRWYSCTLAEPHKVWKFASHGKFLLFHWTRKCGSGEGLQGLLGIWGNVEARGGTTRGSKSCCQERKEQQRRKKKCMDMNVFYKKDQKSTKVFLQNKQKHDRSMGLKKSVLVLIFAGNNKHQITPFLKGYISATSGLNWMTLLTSHLYV